MRTLYESIFDDDDVLIQNIDDSIVNNWKKKFHILAEQSNILNSVFYKNNILSGLRFDSSICDRRTFTREDMDDLVPSYMDKNSIDKIKLYYDNVPFIDKDLSFLDGCKVSELELNYNFDATNIDFKRLLKNIDVSILTIRFGHIKGKYNNTLSIPPVYRLTLIGDNMSGDVFLNRIKGLNVDSFYYNITEPKLFKYKSNLTKSSVIRLVGVDITEHFDKLFRNNNIKYMYIKYLNSTPRLIIKSGKKYKLNAV